MDRSGSPGRRLLHQAARKGLAADVLDEARRRTHSDMLRTGATFGDAAAEFLRYTAHDRG